jgi:hypothetical protein
MQLTTNNIVKLAVISALATPFGSKMRTLLRGFRKIKNGSHKDCRFLANVCDYN